MKTTFIAFLIAVAPGLVFAQCSGAHKDQVVMSCPQGQTLDADTETCVPMTSS